MHITSLLPDYYSCEKHYQALPHLGEPRDKAMTRSISKICTKSAIHEQCLFIAERLSVREAASVCMQSSILKGMPGITYLSPERGVGWGDYQVCRCVCLLILSVRDC